MHATRAITRRISNNFHNAITKVALPEPIHVERARAQHAAYVAALEEMGCKVLVLPGLDAFPDCCFVEDCAVVVGGRALATRPGAPSRRGEVATIADALRAWVEVSQVESPATLDGGDCMQVGGTMFVGRSDRTNAGGVAALRAFCAGAGMPVVEVEVGEWLHLKCVCSPLDGKRMLLAAGTIPAHVFAGMDVLLVPHEEAVAANVVCVGDRVVMPAGFPRTQALLEAAGFSTRALEVSETAKADGALTCMSILLA